MQVALPAALNDDLAGVHFDRTNCRRKSARSMLRWLVDDGSAPLKTRSTPATPASRMRRRSIAVCRPRRRRATA